MVKNLNVIFETGDFNRLKKAKKKTKKNWHDFLMMVCDVMEKAEQI